ncbi:hypothetical protein CN223_25170, partial [Sinorhizobium meliloti]
MKHRYPVDWKSTQVHPVLIALGRELNGRRLHPTLIHADSDEAAPLFRDDCAPGFRDDLAPCLVGSAGD